MAARRVAWRSTAPRRAPANTWNRAIETLEEFGRTHRDHAGSRKFDGQRDAVQALAGLDDGAGVVAA